jgi:hypothetical protein
MTTNSIFQTSVNTFMLLTAIAALTFVSSCKDDDKKKDGTIDITALLLGTWELSETTDPAGLPHQLLYTFEEDGTIIYSVTTRGGRAKSILEGTWRFTDATQTKLEIDINEEIIYTVEALTETTLRITNLTTTHTFIKQ